MNHFNPILLLLLPMLLAVTSCSKRVRNTRVIVQDSIRHYYPMVQGTDLILSYRIANIGETPLVITDIQPSCGCIAEDIETNNIIPPGKEQILKFKYRSEKNTGYVNHSIRVFGNIVPDGMLTLNFDVNVVAPALGSPDYEELYKQRNEFDITTGVKSLVDGDESQRGYWTNDGDYSRGYNKYYWRPGRK